MAGRCTQNSKIYSTRNVLNTCHVLGQVVGAAVENMTGKVPALVELTLSR